MSDPYRSSLPELSQTPSGSRDAASNSDASMRNSASPRRPESPPDRASSSEHGQVTDAESPDEATPDEVTPDEVTPGEVAPDDLSPEAASFDVPAPYRDAIGRLRTRVQEAVSEIESLREENERLRQRVRELESRPSVGEDEVFLTLDDDRDALRARITQFIEAIDRRLDEAGSKDASGADSEADASPTEGTRPPHAGDSRAGDAEPAIDAPTGSVGASNDDPA